MAARTNCFGVPPFFRKKFSGYEGKEQTSKSFKSSKYPKQLRGGAGRGSYMVAGNFTKMNDLQNKILTFRDLLDLSPCISSASVDQLIIWTLKDLGRIYANFRPRISISELEKSPLDKVLNCFCGVLKLIGDLWTNNSQWMVNCKYDAYGKLNQDDLEEQALAMLEDMNRLARERMFDMMDEDETGSSYSENVFGSAFSESYLDSSKTSMSSSPVTPTSILPDTSNTLYDGKKLYYAQPFLLPLRLQAVEKLNPIDLKRLSFHVFSHVAAQDPDFRNQNQRNEIRKLEMPVYDSEVTEEGSDEANLTSEMEEDSSITTLDESENDNGGDQTSVDSAKSTPDAYSPAKLGTDDFQSPTSLDILCSKASESVTPPPEPALLSTNAVPSSPIVAPPTPPPPPPPLPHMFSPNKLIPQPQPEAPASEPISDQSPDIPQNLKTGPATPPCPPPIATGHKAMLSPPTMTSSSTLVFPPPPPPPPPLIPMTSSSTMAFPPPPPISSTMAATIPPPSPITLISNMSFPPPPPPPPTPIASGTIKRPPPPSALGNFAPSPPTPLSTMAKGNMASPLPPRPASLSTMAKGNMAPPPPPPPLPLSTMANGNIAPPPPPPPVRTSSGVPAPPPPRPMKIGGAPAPPPGPGANNLRPKKAATKLKRSSHIGHLYRLVKGKVEGSCLQEKTQKKGRIGASAGGKQGMADALAEMTKRSTYFQQIEEDVKNHAKSISELKVSINSFKNSDMAELQNFHKHVESHLEKLTDETQVLARFEDFPTKKLEALRMAAALDSQLNDITTKLKNWQIESPVNQVLDKIENYFNKIKVQLDALERTKDEETKKFKSQNILFEFSILIRIKELMVDISSSCMELALKEGREAKAILENTQNGIKPEGKKKGSSKVLWRAFQFAYRVYTFAGGHDDRADMLTRQLAHEIETNPSN